MMLKQLLIAAGAFIGGAAVVLGAIYIWIAATLQPTPWH
jgi:hypothetical protein